MGIAVGPGHGRRCRDAHLFGLRAHARTTGHPPPLSGDGVGAWSGAPVAKPTTSLLRARAREADRGARVPTPLGRRDPDGPWSRGPSLTPAELQEARIRSGRLGGLSPSKFCAVAQATASLVTREVFSERVARSRVFRWLRRPSARRRQACCVSGSGRSRRARVGRGGFPGLAPRGRA